MPKSSNSAEASAIRTYGLTAPSHTGTAKLRIPTVQNEAQPAQGTIKPQSARLNLRTNLPPQLKWTKAFRKSAGKEMLVDSTLTFAARRNIPVRYNREHIAQTLKAMERVSEIRAKRERVFYKKRMAGNKEKEKAANRKLVAENEHLLPRLRASERMEEVVEEDPLAEDMALEQPVQKLKGKKRQRLLVGGGVDEMDVD